MTNTLETLEILENGNTNSKIKTNKQSIQLTKYCFTYNNYKKEEIETILSMLKPICKKFVFQEEVGANGTPHLQGSIWLNTKMRTSQFGLPKQIHWEKMRNEKACIAYCQKSETAIGKPYLFGKFPTPIKIIEELKDWMKPIEALTLEEPDDRIINWYWEGVGGIGKSQFTKYMIVKHKCLFLSGGKMADIMNLVFNQDMDECRTIIFDIPRANMGSISYAALESIKNGMICNTKYETGVKIFNPPHIIVFANFPPSQIEKLSEDRWNIVEL